MTERFDRRRTALADRYAIQKELGAGGMATVYLAEDLKRRHKDLRERAVLGPVHLLLLLTDMRI